MTRLNPEKIAQRFVEKLPTEGMTPEAINPFRNRTAREIVRKLEDRRKSRRDLRKQKQKASAR